MEEIARYPNATSEISSLDFLIVYQSLYYPTVSDILGAINSIQRMNELQRMTATTPQSKTRVRMDFFFKESPGNKTNDWVEEFFLRARLFCLDVKDYERQSLVVSKVMSDVDCIVKFVEEGLKVTGDG